MANNPEEFRCFIAIELPEEAKEGLARLKKELERDEHRFVKWADPGGIHLTLKFLGNVPSLRVLGIAEAMRRAARGIPRFHLEISGLGAFPNLKQTRVLWVGIAGEVSRLSILQQNIDSELTTLGFTREERPFVPHLTLARIKQGASPLERRAFGELVGATGFEDKYHVEVEAVSLMRSQLTPARAIYTCLKMAALGH